MAVRTDFTAGEVLAAADLNDTFASKQADVMTTKGDLAAYGTAVDRLAVGANGQVLTADSGETLGVKWADPSGGLTFIKVVTFSGVSSFSENNVFTSDYDNYRLVFRGVSSTASDAQMRLRVGGADATGATDYQRQVFTANGSSLTGSSANSSLWAIGVDGGTAFSIIVDLLGPALAELTTMQARSQRDGSRLSMVTGFHNQSISYDGFTYSDNVGTVTGKCFIYGYQTS